jgi:hypothetical protein
VHYEVVDARRLREVVARRPEDALRGIRDAVLSA